MTSHFQTSTSQAQSEVLPTDSNAELEARIDALWVFPIKSCAGISLPQVVLTSAGLAYDRAWMVVDAQGEMVTQRELPRMALIQPALLHDGERVTDLVMHAPDMAALHLPAVASPADLLAVRVRVWDDCVPAFDMGQPVSDWLTEFLGNSLGPLRLVRFDPTHHRPSSAKWTQGLSSFNQFSDGFPLLVASMASLAELNTRLQAKDEAAVDMRRFRVNVVLGPALDADADAMNAHDEDRIEMLTLHTDDGLAQIKPVKPCPRCPIPNIDPDSGQNHPAVSDALQVYRQDPRVKGALTFGMNCVPVAGVGQVLRVGQRVSANWAF